jgi:hypothetical protein
MSIQEIYDELTNSSTSISFPDKVREMGNQPTPEQIQDILDNALLWHRTGSSIICNPPVLNTDVDFMLFVQKPQLLDFYTNNFDKDWQTNMLNYAGCILDTFRKGTYNILVTTDLVYYNIWATCTDIAIQLNLLKKEDRITLFCTMCRAFGYKS